MTINKWKGYPFFNYGKVFSNKELKWVNIFIPRNCSRSFRECGLFNDEDNKVPTKPHMWVEDYNKYNKIIIIRDPIDRLISGFYFNYENCVTYKKFDKLKKEFIGYINPLSMIWNKNREGRFLRNEVSTPQFGYLELLNIDIKDIEVVMLVESYTDNFNSFVKKYNLLDLEQLHINKNTSNLKLELKEFIKSDSDLMGDIKRAYKKDFELYEEAKRLVIK